MDKRIRIDLENPRSWPEPLLRYLDEKRQVFEGWEYTPDPDARPRAPAAIYDRAIYGLRDVLQPYCLTGWHCTRLTQLEQNHILANGMQLPNLRMLEERIEKLIGAGALTPILAKRLLEENQANDANRAGMIWFCFFPPALAGESGIGRFFRCWGGEAVYKSHENDPETGGALRTIGTPCLIEADIPISFLEPSGGLDSKIVRRFMIHRGFKTSEPVDHEDRAKQPIPTACIRRIICHPDPPFLELTRSHEWSSRMRIPPTKWA